MAKYIILGIINLLLGFFSALILVSIITAILNFQMLAYGDNMEIYSNYAFIIVMLVSALLNSFSLYRILQVIIFHKPSKIHIISYVLLTFVTILWFFLVFVGSIYSSSIAYPVIAIGIMALLFIYSRKFSGKLAVSLSIVTLFVIASTFLLSFQESYCLDKGDRAGQDFVIATKEDAKLLSSFSVKQGTKITKSFKIHMMCHNTYNFIQALRESYLFGL